MLLARWRRGMSAAGGTAVCLFKLGQRGRIGSRRQGLLAQGSLRGASRNIPAPPCVFISHAPSRCLCSRLWTPVAQVRSARQERKWSLDRSFFLVRARTSQASRSRQARVTAALRGDRNRSLRAKLFGRLTFGVAKEPWKEAQRICDRKVDLKVYLRLKYTTEQIEVPRSGLMTCVRFSGIAFRSAAAPRERRPSPLVPAS